MSYLDSKRIVGTNTERVGVDAISGGWKELARTTLGSAQTDIDVTGLADKRYYMILTSSFASGSPDIRLRTGNGSFDSGSNYASRWNENGATDATQTSVTNMIYDSVGATFAHKFNVGYIANLSTKEKLMINHTVDSDGTSAGVAPKRSEFTGKWVNTSNPLDRIRVYGSSNLAIDDEVVVLGWDPADSHTTNFWEELASIDTTTSSDMDTGTFTAKKYLWVQLFIEASGGIIYDARFNGDSGSNYAYRKSTNGGSDGTTTSDSVMFSNHGFGSHPHYENWFIINNASNEKLVIVNSMSQGSAGAGNAPNRQEKVGKWANTSDQITQITINNGGISARYVCKVWGSN